jgi:hypothetical protein
MSSLKAYYTDNIRLQYIPIPFHSTSWAITLLIQPRFYIEVLQYLWLFDFDELDFGLIYFTDDTKDRR